MAKVNYLDKGISSMQPVINAQGLAANSAANSGVNMVEEKCLGYVNLRLDSHDKGAVKVVVKVLGVELPHIGQTASTAELTVMGLSHNEWLIMTAASGETELIARLQKVLNKYHHLVADVTGGTTRLNITGQRAQEMLEKGTYVDLHDAVFKAGQLYATQIAHAPAIIVKNDSNDFSLIVRRSFSHHIAHWAVDAAKYQVSFS